MSPHMSLPGHALSASSNLNNGAEPGPGRGEILSNLRTAEDRLDEEYRVLRVLEEHPEYSQRQIARSTGISLGAINFCIHGLVEKGYVKIENFRKSDAKKNYLYVLTPSGFAARAALTARFLRRKLAEYESLKAEIEALREQVYAEAKQGSDRAEQDGHRR